MGLTDTFRRMIGRNPKGSSVSQRRAPVGRSPDQPTVAIERPPVAGPPPETLAVASDATPTRPPVSPEELTEYVQIKKPSGSIVAVLVAISGELEGEVYKVREGENRLGRADECDVVLLSKRISRKHATLACGAGTFRITPLTDQNPTYVGDQITKGEELGDGALIRMGNTTFRFRTIEGL